MTAQNHETAGMAVGELEIPRRHRIDLFTPAEKAIWDAMLAVEDAEADLRLTDAVNLLQQARGKVADYVDGVDGPETAMSVDEFADEGLAEHLKEPQTPDRDDMELRTWALDRAAMVAPEKGADMILQIAARFEAYIRNGQAEVK